MEGPLYPQKRTTADNGPHVRFVPEAEIGDGARVLPSRDVIGVYYHYDQNNFGAGSPCSSAAKATCSGTFDAVSFAVE